MQWLSASFNPTDWIEVKDLMGSTYFIRADRIEYIRPFQYDGKQTTAIGQINGAEIATDMTPKEVLAFLKIT